MIKPGDLFIVDREAYLKNYPPLYNNTYDKYAGKVYKCTQNDGQCLYAYFNPTQWDTWILASVCRPYEEAIIL